ncbi:MAG: glycosyltransferase 87 family protein [Promethearchaeota archaeon]
MDVNKLAVDKEKRQHYRQLNVFVIISITIALIILRIIFIFFHEELSGIFFIDILMKNRDLNFRTNYDLMQNGVFNYYEENPLIDESAIYLYFWYFIFYPFYIIPFEVSVYIWDLLRFISMIYITINIYKIVQNKNDLLFFIIFSSIGYFADMYLNNTNWLIQLFLYESYIQLEKKRKFLSGIFFALATFKVILIIIPIIYIIIKKIKAKDLIYYVLPLMLICIPYLIFPEYFLSMVSNWVQSGDISSGLAFFSIAWRLIQPAHLMFISIIALIIPMNIKNEILRNKISFIIYTSVFIGWVLMWLIILEFALFL